MSVTKETILKNSYRLFCDMNYEKVTVAELEKATGVSRGGIFHYTGNKKNLFIEVVDKYIFAAHEAENLLPPYSPETKLGEFIYQYVTALDQAARFLISETNYLDTKINKYYHLLLQASKYYPGFSEKIQEMFQREYGLWVKVIENAKATGEIKEELDSLEIAKLFRLNFLGMSYETSYYTTFDTQELYKHFLFIYGLVKK